VLAHADIVWMCNCNGSKRTMCKTSSMLWISNLLGGGETPNVDEKIPEIELTDKNRRGEMNNKNRSGAR
jgi:hypothetical protein